MGEEACPQKGWCCLAEPTEHPGLFHNIDVDQLFGLQRVEREAKKLCILPCDVYRLEEPFWVEMVQENAVKDIVRGVVKAGKAKAANVL